MNENKITEPLYYNGYISLDERAIIREYIKTIIKENQQLKSQLEKQAKDTAMKTTVINCLESYVKKYQNEEKCIENRSLLESPYMIGYFEAKDILNLHKQLKQKENKLNAIEEQIKKEYETVKYDCVPARKLALDHLSEILKK